MNLIRMTSSHTNPFRVRDRLERRFDSVHVGDADSSGWMEMECWTDDRLRLIVRFVYAPPGWTYIVLPAHGFSRPFCKRSQPIPA